MELDNFSTKVFINNVYKKHISRLINQYFKNDFFYHQ